MIKWLRKNIGAIISSIGLVLLAILTFGDMGELFSEQYWANVGGNLTSIGALTIGLVMVQYAIKQGISEQSLSAGLNQPQTKAKIDEHKEHIARSRERMIYAPYFLSMRNERETRRRRREFLIDNNFTSENMLYQRGNKRLISRYKKIQTNITVDSIRWSTTEIVYDKNGRIEKLEDYRKRRAIKGMAMSIVAMLATTLIAGGLFLDTAQIPFWQKLIKFATYIVTMVITVFFSVVRNYEKGAFGVPNELEEINAIWKEFEEWKEPSWVLAEIEKNQNQVAFDMCGEVAIPGKEIADTKNIIEEIVVSEQVQTETTANSGTDLQEEQEEV